MGNRLWSAIGILSLCGLAAADEVTHAVGDVDIDTAVVWARLPGAGAATLTLRATGGEPRHVRAEAVAEDDFIVHYELSRLAGNTRHGYTLRFAPPGGVARYVAEGFFTTAPPPDSTAPVRLAWSGDVAGNNVCRDATRGFPAFGALLDARPDLFVAMGDMIYADNSCEAVGRLGNPQVQGPVAPAQDLEGFRRHWRYGRGDLQLRRLLAAVPYYATWDDHEIRNNFGPLEQGFGPASAPGGDSLLALGRRVFFERNPIRRHPVEADRIYRDFRRGRHLHLFILDTRQYRAPRADPDTGREPKSMLGRAQREWLLKTAGGSDATWRVIVSSVPLVIPTGPAHARDGWASGGGQTGYARELRAIIDDLRATGADNVLWLSGDAHVGAFFRHQIDEAYEVFEAAAGPLSAGSFPPDDYDRGLGSERLFILGPPGGEMTSFEAALGWFNFGLLDIDEEGQAVIRYVNARGGEVWQVTMPPRRPRHTQRDPAPAATRPIGPQPEAPQPEAPQPVPPQPIAPQPVAPQPVAPQPVAPQPVAPQPETPQPETPQPETPQPKTPQPKTPQPETPQPETPQPEAPQPEAPQPVAPQPDTGDDPPTGQTSSS